MNSVKLAELDWMTYRDRVQDGGSRILLPVGAIEQHGPHMSLNPDVLIPEYIACRVAERSGNMLVAPPIAYGYKSQVKSGGGNFFPGTTCVGGRALEEYAYDVILAYAAHGNREFVLINGHFENSMFLVEAADRAVKHARLSGKEIRVVLLSYWDFISEATIEKVFPDGFSGWAVEHGGVLETSIMLKIHPELVDMAKAVDIPPAEFPPYDVFPPDPSWVPSSGTLSSPAQATAEKGEWILDECIAGIARTFG
ncbi:creatininase [Halomonas sp. MCCC 1A17488]|uniref:Creatininase n=1 Tax=Billgrantia sulfidoxydans TaxID=2733484 RepID=A0ABX7W398_9GAMM|nr:MULTISPECIES: creatininase [Halomonas]MCE8016976.1 creatininase [Halomonas sp. MCCC 1A17488]MCG3240309.1 creatininase [Halomonas sp. MCCC 1A17488]QTP53429.1 creatininase [Halomonas sulfidoxydans]